jgi:hypothetical protein
MSQLDSDYANAKKPWIITLSIFYIIYTGIHDKITTIIVSS